MRSSAQALSLFFLGLVFFSLPTFAAEKTPRELEDIGIEEHLGAKINLDLQFMNESGTLVPLKSYFSKGKPVLMALVYYECPSLCQILLSGLNQSLQDLKWNVGDQFDVVAISINPTETSDLAAAKKESHREAYARPGTEEGWHFLVDHEGAVKTLADELGFRYKYDTESQQYAHAAAIMILTPEGKISRYLYGVGFDPKTLKLALMEGAEGRIGSVIDKVILFCHAYDPKTHRYALIATRLMSLGGLLTVLFLCVTIGGFHWKGRR